MDKEISQKLFRDSDGNIQVAFNTYEGVVYQKSPLDFFIMLARYKFAARLLQKTDYVLDAGCGSGLGTIMLSHFVKEVVGADHDLDLINYCKETYKEQSNINFIKVDLKQNESIPSIYDAIVCLDVIEHLSKEDGEILIKNLRTKLKTTSGLLILGTPNLNSQPYASTRRKEAHLYEYDFQALKGVVDRHFSRSIIFSMTDEVVSTSFSPLAWYYICLCY